MRVALDARVATDHFPGIGRVAVQLSTALSRLLPADELLALQPARSATSRLGPPTGIPVRCEASPFSVAQQWQVPRLLAQRHADVYHSLFFGMPLRPGVPTAWTCHDLIPLVVPGLLDAPRRFTFAALHRLAAHASDRIIAVSRATRDDLVRHLGVPAERIAVVPWGVDDRFRNAVARPDPALAARLGGSARYWLYVGVNKPHKNLPRLVRALARAQATKPTRDLHLVIAGAWDPRFPEARDAAAQANVASRVHMLGPVPDDDLPALYAGATGFLFPSLYEGFGLPVLEAMACGLPTMTSNRSSLPEVAGDAALLVSPLDEEEMAAAIGRLADDPGLRDELARRGRARAAGFTWQDTAGQMIEIYRELAGRPRPGEGRKRGPA